ncbi:MAG: hypothetical protein AXA67_00170 [Methylothermaceae bacteria B42]|nr:MAG: hypothetical protein AXA67_00170 [Methylothermaceae bacteria B42]HHJ38869.1 DUF3592 domain-containing protein [Methylothermaceae bacterium]
MHGRTLVTGTLMIALGVIASTAGLREMDKLRELREYGLRASARVVEIDSYREKVTSPISYIPVLEWTTADGHTVRVQAGFSSPQQSSWRIGERFSVRYDPQQPDQRYLVERPDRPALSRLVDHLGLVIGGIFLLTGLAIFVMGLRRHSR